MKNILACDGGMGAIFSLQIIGRIETLLTKHYRRSDFVLADHFDFIAGTSTGGIIAACLSMGMSADETLKRFILLKEKMLAASSLNPKTMADRYDSLPFSLLLKEVFSENDVPMHLSSKKLRTVLLMVTRGALTGDPFPITNNPIARYNTSFPPQDLLLWKVARASIAAPDHFPAETFSFRNHTFGLADGAITAYKNPALLALETAIYPKFGLHWPVGVDKIRLISVGSLHLAKEVIQKPVGNLAPSRDAENLAALTRTASSQQDRLCRIFGKCLAGPMMDAESGDMSDEDGLPKLFSYVRYDKSVRLNDLVNMGYPKPTIDCDSMESIDFLNQIGSSYAQENVKIEHLV